MYPYTLDFSAGCINADDTGRMADFQAKAVAGLVKISQWHRDGSKPFLSLFDDARDLAEIDQAVARAKASGIRTVAVLGTGGSSLGAQTLVALKDAGFGNPGGVHLRFFDNVDPDTFSSFFATIRWPETLILAVSKSGSTGETLTQLLVCLEQAKSHKVNLPQHFLCVTEPGDNAMRQLAAQEGLPVLEHILNLGGRYSIFSNTGMLPAAFAGVNIRAVRAGGKAALDAAFASPQQAPAALGAAWACAMAANGRNITVCMPYIDALGYFAFWYRQLWAESIGKKGIGTTPVRAMGTVDQHSQLQLYLDGPDDKCFTMITRDISGHGLPVGKLGDKRLEYLSGHVMGDVLSAMQEATYQTFAARKRPVRRFHLAQLDETAMGALLMHFMLETIIAAHIWDVDAFDQPAVEDGKIIAKQLLAHKQAA